MDRVQRIQMESLNNVLYMGTITYDNEHLPWEQIGEYNYRYADQKQLSNTIKRLRANNTFGIPFRTLYVSERGGKYGRPHFHILFLFRRKDIGNTYNDYMTFEYNHKWDLFNEWKVNKGTRNNPVWEMLSQYRESYRNGKKRTTYDFHYINPITTDGGVTDAAFYVLKYMLKGNDEEQIRIALKNNYDARQAWEYWKKVSNKEQHGLGFGLGVWKLNGSIRSKDELLREADNDIVEHLNYCVQRSLDIKAEYPMYFCPENTMTFPLCKYYKNIGPLLDIQDHLEFWNNSEHKYGDIVIRDEERTQTLKKIKDYETTLKIFDRNVFSDTCNELYNL